MSQVDATVSLHVSKGRQYLRVVPRTFVVPNLDELGFKPTMLEPPFIAWDRVFHPAIIRQVRGLFPKVEESNELRDLLISYELDNIHATNGELLQDDKELKDYQEDAAYWLSRRKRAFLALAPGLGKSFVSLRAAEAAGYKLIFIVAPLSLLDNWRKEIVRWLPDTRVIKFFSEGDERYGSKGSTNLIALFSYESFQRRYPQLNKKLTPDLLIFDETVLLKNRDTVRYSGAKEKLDKRGKLRPAITGIADLVKSYDGSLWLLSGGPRAKLLDDLWAQFHLLDAKRFSSYWQFAQHYCVVMQDQWGTHVIADKPGAIELLKRDTADIYYARTQDEVENLPEFIFENIEVEMEKDQAAIYETMEKEFLAELPSGDEVVAINLLTQLLRLTQIASNASLLEDAGIIPLSSAKWDMVESLLEFVEGPVLIWTNFIRTAALLGKRFGKRRIGTLTGEIEVSERQRTVDAFQNGSLDILIAHPKVGKFGYTLTKARTAIYVERSYNGDDYYQSLYRIRRIGTRESPRIIHLLSTHKGCRTVDHAIDAVLQYRHENNVAMTSGNMLRKAWEGTLK